MRRRSSLMNPKSAQGAHVVAEVLELHVEDLGELLGRRAALLEMPGPDAQRVGASALTRRGSSISVIGLLMVL
jgi:hypothetical protein